MNTPAESRGDAFASAESAARDIWEYQPAYILSLLRTRAYIQAESDFAGVPISEDKIARRLQRQQCLYDPDKQFRFIMAEAAFRWRLAPAAVMKEQIDHIISLSRLANICVSVIPWRKPVGVVAGHAFHVYDQRLVLVGTAHTVLSVSASEQVNMYVTLHQRLLSAAATGPDGEAEMLRIRDDF
jgi:hypothetical protein